MGSKYSTIYSSSVDYFSAKKTCTCTSKYWKSYQMDLNIAEAFHYYSHEKTFMEQEIVTVYFRCSNCEAEFPLSMYYFNGEFYRKYGSFKRYLTFNDRISTVFQHNSLKSILFILSQSNKIYTSENYAIDLYKTLSKFEYC
uniref:Uncharacterized protein n=1 Tax=Panagrolaimus sp. PS1159 TaxID=55785 RepID=A0AC35GPG8_9BILA